MNLTNKLSKAMPVNQKAESFIKAAIDTLIHECSPSEVVNILGTIEHCVREHYEIEGQKKAKELEAFNEFIAPLFQTQRDR